MPAFDNRDRKKRKGSLLTLVDPHADGRGTKGGRDGREPVAAADELAVSPAERHEIARSRREAGRSPLIKALSRHSAESGDDIGIQDAPQPNRQHRAEPGWSGLWVPRSDGPARAVPADRSAKTDTPGRGRDVGTRTSSDERDPYWRPLIDPMAVIGGIFNSKGLIAATTICGALLGVFIALSTPKEYQAIAEMLVDPRDIKFLDRDLTSGGLPSDATLALVENQVRVILSGTVMNKTVARLNLDQDPEFNGEGGSGGLGSLLSGLTSLLSLAGGEEGANANRHAITVENLFHAVDAERGGKTFVISIAAKSESPQKAALIANTVTEVFLETYGDLQSGTAGKASDELSSRLAELRAGVEAAERQIEAFKAENDIVDAQGRLISDDEIIKLNDQLATARARTLELNARASSARSVSVDSILTGNLPEQINSPVLTEMRAQYSTLRQEADRLGAKLGPRHPERAAVEAQLVSARQQISQELRLVAQSIQVDLKRAVQLEQELAARLAQLKARQANLSDELVTVRELEREASAKRAVYEGFLLRARETGQQKDINAVNISVISEAMPPLEPTGMSRKTMTVLATMFGFAAGVGLGGARGAYDSFRASMGRASAAPVGPPAPASPTTQLAPAERRREPDEPDEPDDNGVSAVRKESPQAEFVEASGSESRHRESSATEPAATAAETAEEADMHRMPDYSAWPATRSPETAEPAPGPHGQYWYDPATAAHYPAPGPVYGWYPGFVGEPASVHRHASQPRHPWAQPGHGYPPASPAYWPRPIPQAQPYWPDPQHNVQPWQHHAPPHAPQADPAGYGAAPHVDAAAGRPVTDRSVAAQDHDGDAINEIRESLREFREALRELSENRGRRRFI
ncbi:succinoglycan biosynthesis protein exop [Nitratireductor sp. CAU 1489]|uniref:Succinoglycan biosynthesis protein exop n=1 Tax=Nitratireductor arenosus TaxID=2682096 RepID=A0A844QJD7_9HYPH|nr:succinoglycan biosynthesis protein exop [Nitratireductor arenosus]